MQEEKIKKLISESKYLKDTCPVCNRRPYSRKFMSVGVCHQCRDVLRKDIYTLYRCAEDALAGLGYVVNDVYLDSRKGDLVSSRRLLASACLTLSSLSSREFASIMRMRGKTIESSSVRHLVLVARDLYDVSKSYRELMDKYMKDVLERYIVSENAMKRTEKGTADLIAALLIKEGVCMEEGAMLLSNKILNVIELG
jgi:ribosomal protein L37AE/L43A